MDELSENQGNEMRRWPAKERAIGEIKSFDKRVALIGNIVGVDIDNAEAKMDDNTGTILLIFTDLEMLKKIQTGRLTRVIGRPYNSQKGNVINVEVAQDIDGFDTNTYKRIKELEAKGM
ncbi:MAG: replication protein RepA [Candidatus Diapherotrites archaeon]|nr:replication protein RepA [Candidatus Diapherotrites archaeon]